jgi:UDP-GlcNAc:undecaprenyl-phosphate GlcNAc-1-phosphate transferase
MIVLNIALWLLLPAVAAAALAFALTPLTARLAVWLGAIDMPGYRKTHSTPIPRLGGLAVVTASASVWAAAAWLFGSSVPRELSIGLIVGGLPILAVSALDDVKGVRARHKLLVHVVGASMAVASGVSLGETVHLFDVAIPVGLWSAPLSVLWLIGVTNAFNLIDGLDGLSAGLGLIAAVCMAAVFGLAGQPVMASAALVLAGALAGFLPYNLHPARLFLGDVGATALGFCLGAFALKGGSTLSSGFAAVVPVFIMGLPIADTLIAMARRMIVRLESGGGGLFVADRNHIHHRLLAHGIGHERAVLMLYGAGLVCAVGAFLSLFLQARHAALFILAVLVAGGVGVRRLGYDEFAFIRRGTMLRVYDSPAFNTSMFIVFVDLAMSAIAAYLAIGLKREDWMLRESLDTLIDLVALFAPAIALSFWCSGIYRRSWRVADVADLARACGAVIGATIIGAVAHPLLAPTPLPTSLFSIYGLVAIVLVMVSRASYVVLRRSQRRASHRGIPALLYGADTDGIAAAHDLFEDPGAVLKPIGFVDDDPGKTGRLFAGLPVMGRSYELASLIESYDAKAVVLTSATVSLDAQTRVANACRHHGIGLYHMHVQLDRVIEAKEACVRTDAAAVTVASKGTPNAAATFAHAPLSILISESEPCVRCGGRNVHRSRTKGVYERVRKWHTPARPFRCNDCGWRGWLFPLERGIAFDEAGESDLRSLDAAFTTLATVGESAGGSERR